MDEMPVERQQTVLLPATESGASAQAVTWLRRGGLVAFPTDTVYGVGALAWDEAAVARLYTAKRRPAHKAIPLLLSTAEQCALVVGAWSVSAERLAARFWPGPLTLVMLRSPRVSDAVTAGGDTVAVRVPDHPLTLALLALLGEPLAATSANLSGRPDPLTAQAVLEQLAGRVDLVLDGGACPGGLPSTVVDLTWQPPRLLRIGPVSAAEIESALR